MKYISKHFLGLLTVFMFFVGCASSKKSDRSKGLTFEQKTRFENAYFEGAKLKAVGDYTGAANKFADAFKINPSSHAAMYQLANLNMGVRNFYDAIYYGERSIKLNPQYNFWYYGQLAQAYSKVSDFKKSAETFKLMIDKEPDRKSNYIEAGNQFINAHDYKLAISVFNSFEKKFGVEEESARKKEGLYFELGKPKDGIDAMKALVEAFPEIARYKGLLAESYARNKQFTEAINTYKEIILHEPDNGYAFFGLADVYRKLGESDLSFEYLLKAFNDKNMSVELKIKVIGSYYVYVRKDEKMQQQALQLCKSLVKMHPTDPAVYIAHGDILYASGKISEARNNLAEAVELDASDINVWRKLMSLDDELENFVFLEADSRKAIEFYPNHTFLFIINAFANYTLKNYKSAQKISSDGLEISVIKKDRIDLLTTLADASHELGEYDKSDAAFEEILELDNANLGALNNFAYYLAVRKQKLDKAMVMIKKALTISPNEATYKDTYGWILYQQEDYTAAVKVLKEAFSVLSEDAEVMEHYAMALIKTGEEVKGNELLQKSQSIKNKKP